MRQRFSRLHASVSLVAVILGGCMGAGLVASATDRSASTAADDHARRGEVYDGLQRGDSQGPCRGAYEAHTKDGKTMCSHGPDPAPDGVDVSRRRSTSELAGATDTGTGTSSSPLLPCYGDGSSGKRVEAIYARASDVSDRFASIASLIPQWAAKVDSVIVNSAGITGGVRHVRWVTAAGSCSLSVANVVLSTTGDDNITNTMNELKTKGYNRTDRKYLIWMDATRYCGIGTVKSDDRPTPDNANNAGPSYGRIDSGCWNATNSTAAHEMMHNLGSVQLSAPHSTGGWHCTDESDRMCYPDASGVTMSYACPSQNEALLDCGGNDYFSTSPVANSYLATHWNTASSAFLSSAQPDAWGETSSTGGTTSPTPTPTPVVTPSPTPSPIATSTPTPTPAGTSTTVTYTDSLNKKVVTRSYPIAAGGGTLSSSLSFTRASSLTVRIRNAWGHVLSESSGGSPTSVSVPVGSGQYTIEVSGSQASYALKITYPRP